MSHNPHEQVRFMKMRKAIVGTLVVLHAAIVLLGSAGVHALLGCQHNHLPVQGSCDSTHTHTHHHSHCHHTHSHPSNKPHEPEQAPGVPETDDNCAICQYFASPVDAVEVVEWSPSGDLLKQVSLELKSVCVTAPPRRYDVRGPPAWI